MHYYRNREVVVSVGYLALGTVALICTRMSVARLLHLSVDEIGNVCAFEGRMVSNNKGRFLNFSDR